jgi:hypothetical protein
MTLLVSLLLGAGVHEWHHLKDPGCGAPGETRQHACWCSSLHASANVVQTAPAPGPAPVPAEYALHLGVLLPLSEFVAGAQPRAPPTA